jgi:outer membrane receptor for Fe3+-dicitrate
MNAMSNFDFRGAPCRALALACAFAPLAGLAAEAEHRLSEIVVSGQASPFEERRAAVTRKTVLDRQAIEATGGLTVGEVLGKLPGVELAVRHADRFAHAVRRAGLFQLRKRRNAT